ncbi:MAG: hydroxyethylthiazole kinase [Halanaerobiales bacterium]
MRKDFLINGIIENYERLKKESPLIQQITNFVSIHEQANITLAAGARPIMADCPVEFDDIIAQADALLLNIGTINDKRRDAILQANETARKYKVPVVLDPVGVGASSYVRELALELLESGNISIVKGNAGEIFSLVGIQLSEGVSGVDYVGEDIMELPAEELKKLPEFSRKYGLVTVITGEKDLLIDSENQLLCSNGVPLLAGITGSGCMAGSLLASYLAICADPLLAALTGISILCISAELAAREASGPGSFRILLHDRLASLEADEIRERLKFEFIELA